MKKVYTAKDVATLLNKGGSPDEICPDAILTPSAKDAISDYRKNRGKSRAGSARHASSKPIPEPIVPDYEYKWEAGNDPKTPAAIQDFFHSPEITEIKRRMVDIGRRIWEKDYVDGNGGNITVRVGDALVLCTPTLISKGFMQMEDICLVDFEGNQVAGTRKRTSEVNTHIGIMKRQPKCKSCVHAHPPHGTAFAVAAVCPPTCLIPEAEVFLGQIALAPYRTPGSAENADVVGEMGVDHQSVLMESHGVITWGKDVEDAYWKMENTDAYCKTVWIASQLGNGLKTISGGQLKELLQIRKSLGMDDNRLDLKECELCDNSEFRPGVMCSVPDTAATESGDPEIDALVKQVTDQILKQMG